MAAFSSRGLAFAGVLKPELVAPGVSVPTSEPGRTDEGEIRYGTVSGTSVSAAVAAGAVAVLAQARPRASAARICSGWSSDRRGRSRTATSRGLGRLDLQAAVQQEVAVVPATVSFGAASESSETLDQPILVHNVSTRAVTIAIRPSRSDGVEVSALRKRLRLRAGRSAEIVLRADVESLGHERRSRNR